ncbi:Bicarbonate transporter BicA [Hydrogenovibrio crunogenus]|uniref:Bicarbonate transporter BicA n=1 Tax=Hydrogenovibrio crunogenus TaxID=39765 RepID=A0A4P7P0M1_9GAMM|nr:SulP family inorganic anion transporter [Hydrogenovibrio crunogenus]QBZ83568.1 Bicarbonate transporter BicA [Hydrogenovibrio crunogenus]RUM92249.1 MAG: sodium-independent anion transporter [Thiomicrospira sp.]
MNQASPNAFDWRKYKADTLSGITVSLALVPEAVAFAFVAGVHPLVGLYAAIIVGFITAVFGGRPGMISAAAGSLAVVMMHLVMEHGASYLFAAVIMMGVFQIFIGWMKWGRFIRMVPSPVMLGFVNGLALVILMAQFTQFTDSTGAWLSGDALMIMIGIIIATMAIIYLLPRLTKAVPSALAAIVLVTLAVIFFDMNAVTVGDRASVSGTLESLVFGDGNEGGFQGLSWLTALPEGFFSLETLWIILPYALILTVIGSVESLLTMTLIDDITETRGQGNRECVALGAANCTAGAFGTMGGCALIGQSMINVNSGGTGRLSGISAALGLLVIVLIASTWIEMVPIGALVGLMFFVVIATFNWSSWNIMRGMSKMDAFVMVLVTVLTVIFDLAIAVIAGVIVSALVFAWQHAQKVMVETEEMEIDGKKGKVYRVNGPLFFASSQNFIEMFSPKHDPECVQIDFQRSRVYDHTGVEAINNLTQKYKAEGKKVVLKHLSPECQALLKDAKDLVEVNVSEDPHYHVSLGK